MNMFLQMEPTGTQQRAEMAVLVRGTGDENFCGCNDETRTDVEKVLCKCQPLELMVRQDKLKFRKKLRAFLTLALLLAGVILLIAAFVAILVKFA